MALDMAIHVFSNSIGQLIVTLFSMRTTLYILPSLSIIVGTFQTDNNKKKPRDDLVVDRGIEKSFGMTQNFNARMKMSAVLRQINQYKFLIALATSYVWIGLCVVCRLGVVGRSRATGMPRP